VPSRVLHLWIVLRPIAGCPGRGAEAAERHVPVRMDFFRLVLPAERALTSARPYRGNMTRVQSFPPIVSERSKLLILGSMPGELSLKVGQYYAHPRNAFWPIMGELFGAGPSLSYQERVAILQSVGVALWDTLKGCTTCWTAGWRSSLRPLSASGGQCQSVSFV